jgi:hypothetical protein
VIGIKVSIVCMVLAPLVVYYSYYNDHCEAMQE